MAYCALCKLEYESSDYHDELWDGWIENGGDTLCIYPNGPHDHLAEILLRLAGNKERTSLL